jgi:cobalt-zinc-cadmium efflux system membrane fusion protein
VLLAAMSSLFLHHRAPGTQADDRTAAPGTFRPTREQWAGLKLELVGDASFRAALATDGNIAFDDDLTTPVFSPYTGRVTRILAKAGDVVSEGAPLMMVQGTEFAQAQNDLATAAAALATAGAQLAQAQANESRQHDLYLAKAGALKDWLQSQTDMAVARATLHSSEVALDAARGKLRVLGRSEAEIAQLEKAPASHAANPEIAVRSPISGTVISRQVGPGQYITSAANGATAPAFTIGDLSKVWLVANVRETDAAWMVVGRPIEVRVPAYPGRVFSARLDWVAASVDPATHRLPVRAEIDNRDHALKPMMFATFSIATGDASQGLAVPRRALVYEGDRVRVFVSRTDGTIAAREVRTGRQSGDVVEIVSGLARGESVVTAGAVFIDRATSGS